MPCHQGAHVKDDIRSRGIIMDYITSQGAFTPISSHLQFKIFVIISWGLVNSLGPISLFIELCSSVIFGNFPQNLTPWHTPIEITIFWPMLFNYSVSYQVVGAKPGAFTPDFGQFLGGI